MIYLKLQESAEWGDLGVALFFLSIMAIFYVAAGVRK